MVVVTALVWLTLSQWETADSGNAAAAPIVKSDEEQIHDVLQAITDAYNAKDVKGAEAHLCAQSRSRWTERLESVWMTYRLEHGTYEFAITSITLRGATAHVTGTQTYSNDGVPTNFTAEMGRGISGWKMCGTE